MTDGRLIATELGDGDAPEISLRPKSLSDFVGQPQLRANLSVFIEAARARRSA